jgi:hypothetical protein
MNKSYVQPGEIATILNWEGKYQQVDAVQIKRIVWDRTKQLPIDEVAIGPDQIIGFDEDGSYVCLVH